MTAPLFAAPTDHVVRVALPVPLPTAFDYAVPASLSGAALPGVRVLVPFAGRELAGLVVGSSAADGVDAVVAGEEHTPRPGESKPLQPVKRVLDEEPVLSRSLMQIIVDAADEAFCPVGIALFSALPAGSAPKPVEQIEATPLGRQADESGAVAGAAGTLLRRIIDAGALSSRALARSGAPGALDTLIRDGLVRRARRLAKPTAREATLRFFEVAPATDVETLSATVLARAPKQAALLRKLAERGALSTRDLDAKEQAAARALEKRGFATCEVRKVPRNVLGAAIERDAAPALTPEQTAALDPVCRDVREHRFTQYLLHGVTGSGKTEVYLHAVEEALAAGRQALVLVPEISLTHQIVARLRARFGDGLAVLHSGLRPGERLEQWERLRAGDTPIAVGARSALFAPLEKLGVIVIDEEHDGAYKNEEGFRYHARSLAERRARAAGCPLILGSATPALETRHRAEAGEIERLTLERRIGGRPLPGVEIVDLNEERKRGRRGAKLIVTRPLERALRETVAEGGQAILFLNRRGFSTQIFCFDCGFAERCPHCDVALVYHAPEQLLRCHYCEFQKPTPDRCGGCGQPDIALLGVGTQRLEEEIRALLPDARVARLDRDVAQKRGALERTLGELRDGHLDVLIGTQMVAKGHDFPGVRLVGVIAADLGLHMPDFRAAERTFQLLTQVAGRAGRAGAPGRVLLQTFIPDHYAIAPVVTHDYERFYREEVGYRAGLGYPPFGALAQVLLTGEDDAATRRAGEALVADVGEIAGVDVIGPAVAPLARLRGRFRYYVVAKGASDDAVRAACARLAAGIARLPREITGSLDAAPVQML